MKKLFIIFILGIVTQINADVYLFGPRVDPSNKGNAVSLASPSELSRVLKQSKLWDEPVTINGMKTKLGISLLTSQLDILLRELKNIYPNAKIKSNSQSSLIRTEDENYVYKIYIVSIGGKYSAIQFSMKIPKNIKLTVKDWPSEIPMIGTFTPLTYMIFPDRNSFFGHFATPSDNVINLYQMDSAISADGWESVTKESSSPTGRGDMYLKDDKILILNFSGEKGSIYTKTLPQP